MNTLLNVTRRPGRAASRAIRRLAPALALPLLLCTGCAATIQRSEFEALSKSVSSLKSKSDQTWKGLKTLEENAQSKDEANESRTRMEEFVDERLQAQGHVTANHASDIGELRAAVESNKQLLDQRTKQSAGFVTRESLETRLDEVQEEIVRQGTRIQVELDESVADLERRAEALENSFENLMTGLRRHYAQLGESLSEQYGLILRQYQNFDALVAGFSATVTALANSSKDLTTAGAGVVEQLRKQTESFGGGAIMNGLDNQDSR